MLPADLLPWFDALPPFVGGIPCRLFIACGRPNQDRSSLPARSVLLLHAKREQEEPEGVIERGTVPLGVGTQGSFY